MADDRLVDMHRDEEDIGLLLGLLPPAPEGWVAAAAALPVARRALEGLGTEFGDEAAREAQTARLEQALADAGVEPTPELLSAVRRGLGHR